MVDSLGWGATAVFLTSYFCTRANTMRRIQMIGALMWSLYGLLMHAPPVVVANLLVFFAAAWTRRHSRAAAEFGEKRPNDFEAGTV